MGENSAQAGPIAVYGATGYTGRLIAAELRRRGAEMVLAGRNPAKLEILAEDLGGSHGIQAAPLDDPQALEKLLEPCAAVITCAGPFALHGEPVLSAAVEARTHYIDTAGEQPFIRTVFERYGAAAERAGVALVTAMGFDYALGDMMASLVAEGMGPLDEIVVAYAVRGFSPTRGTALSALGIIAGDDAEWRDGELVPASGGVGRGHWDFPAPVGRQRVLRYPAGEHIMVPRHVEARAVQTLLTASTFVPVSAVTRVAPLVMPSLKLAMRTPIRRVAEAVIARFPEGPSEDNRRRVRFTVDCEARLSGSTRRGTVTGTDVYALTARTTVEGALRCAAHGYEAKGALAPSQAFRPREFLDALAEYGVEYEVR